MKDWFTGLAMLTCWNTGTYQPGMEKEIDRHILTYEGHQRSWSAEKVWEAYYEWKFGEQAVKKLSEATEENARMVWKKLSGIRHRKMDSLTIDELQAVVNASGTNVTIVSNKA